MKKLINDPFQVTIEEIEGFVAAFPRQVKRAGSQSVVRSEAPVAGKVSVIFGGGSGHEPTVHGLPRQGACRWLPGGQYLRVPSPGIVLDATRVVSSGAGVLYLYGNYSGDCMNFDMAAELAEEEGIRIETVRGNRRRRLCTAGAEGAPPRHYR